jgi:hypothetical protein
VGLRPRGLQRRRRRLELLPPRPRPVARVPLERGRDGRPVGCLQSAVPCPRALERHGSDPEGADVRADEPGGESRRGRQGVLVVPRRRPEQRVAPLALSLPAAGVPVPAADRCEPVALEARTGVRTARYRCLRRRPLLDRRGRLRQGRSDGHPHARGRPQSGPGDGNAARPADALVPERLVVGSQRRPTAAVDDIGRREHPGVASGPRDLRAPRGSRPRRLGA